MALYFIKDTTLTGIADAIRSKTGDTSAIPVASMASKISSIVADEGGGSDGGYTTRIVTANGSFDTSVTGTGRQTINHGLGVKPDMVIVYLKRTADYSVTSKYCAIFNTSKSVGLGGVAVSGGYSFGTSGCLEEYSDPSQIYCPNDSTFQVGSDSTFLENVEYYWQAMVVLKSESTSSGDHTVTFLSEDGQTVLYRKAVMNGDSCGDPVSLGLIEKPTKENSAEFDYAFAGWSTTPGGEVDPDALANITGDKTVYACFVGVLRMYTIKYYDGDTLLHSEKLVYGATPSYTPNKAGYVISGWVPEFTPVTGDAEYQVQWEYLTLASASWERIAEISESGMASTYFSLGDSKTFTFTRSGATVTGAAVIIGFDHDDKADGSGKAGITFMLISGIERVNNMGGTNWSVSTTRTLLNSTIFPTLTAEMQSAIKTVTKLSSGGNGNSTLLTTEDKLFLPCLEEIGKSPDGTNFLKGEGTKYEGYPDKSKFSYENSSYKQYLTRSCRVTSAGYGYVKNDGTYSYSSNVASEPKFCFCV